LHVIHQITWGKYLHDKKRDDCEDARAGFRAEAETNVRNAVSAWPNFDMQFGNGPAWHGTLVQEVHQAFLKLGVFESSHIALHKVAIDIFEETISGMVPKILFHGNRVGDSTHRIILAYPRWQVAAGGLIGRNFAQR
jgi:hypothetical protein